MDWSSIPDLSIRSMNPTLEKVKQALRVKKLEMPMLCYSPNFTVADAAQRQKRLRSKTRWST